MNHKLSSAERLIKIGSVSRLMSDFSSLAEIESWLNECGIRPSEGRARSLVQSWEAMCWQKAHPDRYPDQKDFILLVSQKKGKAPHFTIYKRFTSQRLDLTE